MVKPEKSKVLMTVMQCKMARAALGWGIRDLAAAATVSPDTVARLERGDTRLQARTHAAIRRAFEDAGVEFLDEDGVRFRRLE